MLTNQFAARLVEIAEATSFRPVAMKICSIVSRPQTTIGDIEALLAMDTVLTARTLQVANSPFFNRGRKTGALSHALTLIGFDTLRMIVLSAAIYDLYQNPVEIDRKLWEHSMGVSLAASMLARETGLVGEQDAAAAGLFHDAGKILMRNAFPEPYAEMIKTVEGTSLSFCESEARLFGINHMEAGGILAKKWNLPREYAMVIGHHHDGDCGPPLHANETALIKITAAADTIAFYLGMGLKRDIGASEIPGDEIRISSGRLKDLMQEMQELYADHVNTLRL